MGILVLTDPFSCAHETSIIFICIYEHFVLLNNNTFEVFQSMKLIFLNCNPHHRPKYRYAHTLQFRKNLQWDLRVKMKSAVKKILKTSFALKNSIFEHCFGFLLYISDSWEESLLSFVHEYFCKYASISIQQLYVCLYTIHPICMYVNKYVCGNERCIHDNSYEIQMHVSLSS